MRQTLAIFLDAYRELNAKRLFWFVLVISGLVVAAFAAIGINERGLTVLWWEFELFGLNSNVIPPERLYKEMFSNFGIGMWLAWIATVLALVSTAGIFPDFIASGSIELTLSKPVGRLRLFLTKFVAGLLFVALQVSVFTAASFLVIGVRGGAWEPGLFVAVPLVVLLFSYLFSVCVLLGMLTRSTVASVLLTLLVWVAIFAVNAADGIVIQGREANAIHVEQLPGRIETLEKRARAAILRERAGEAGTEDADGRLAAVVGEPTREELEAKDPTIAERRGQLERAERHAGRWRLASNIAFGVKTVLPKTGETVALLSRTLEDQAELAEREAAAAEPADFSRMAGPFGVNQRALAARVEKVIMSRSVLWVIGTSLVFEAVMLGLAAWIFCRRDF